MSDDVKAMLQAIYAAVECDEISLNEWEEGFIQTVSAADRLTDKQDAVLERIWRKATGRSE
jgi:hypothetical protein